VRKFSVKLTPIYGIVFLGVLMLTLVTNRTATVMTESAANAMRHTVIIDAGHGGVDGGATSCTGVLESAVNLQIAIRLNDLMHLIGYDTKMIRTTDISVYTEGNTIAAKKISDLKARVRLVNETPNAILVSIHQNYFSEGRYKGAQVFYPKTQGSDILAKSLQSALISALNPGSKRQAKSASGIYLMEHIHCTGVLIECGFLSNPEEEANLRSAIYQKKISCVIASSIAGFLS